MYYPDHVPVSPPLVVVVEVGVVGVVAGALAAGVLTLGVVPVALVVVEVLLPQPPTIAASIVRAAVSSSGGDRGERCGARAQEWRLDGSLRAVPGVRCGRMMASFLDV